MSEQRTELDKLGEFGLIDHLTQNFTNKNERTILGIGDDAAVLTLSENESQLNSTDMSERIAEEWD